MHSRLLRLHCCSNRVLLSDIIKKSGEVAEWLKAHDSKSCMRQRIGGSNPPFSAKRKYQTLCLVFSLGKVVNQIPDQG